jgi:hypothetical protein
MHLHEQPISIQLSLSLTHTHTHTHMSKASGSAPRDDRPAPQTPGGRVGSRCWVLAGPFQWEQCAGLPRT